MENKLTRSGRKAFFAPIIWIVVTGVAFFIASGDISIIRAWIYMIILIVIRTYYEDITLQNELTGYREYCKEVKYRLIPYLW